MRNKKSLLSLCLLALVLVLGVGYAVVSAQDLQISGSAATVDGGKMDVAFTDVSDTAKTIGTAGIAATGSVTDLVATINVTGLAAIGDSAELTYTLTNREVDLAAEITKGAVSVKGTDDADLSSYYLVTVTIPENNVIANNDGVKNNTMDVKVKVELIKLPINDVESTADITVGLVASPVQPN